MRSNFRQIFSVPPYILGMSTRAHDDAIMWGVAIVLAVVAVASIVGAIVLFVKKKTAAGVLVLIGGILCGLLALAIGALMALAMFAWH